VLPKHFWFRDLLDITLLFAEHYVELIFMPAFRLEPISVEGNVISWSAHLQPLSETRYKYKIKNIYKRLGKNVKLQKICPLNNFFFNLEKTAITQFH
jgi:hypothetical protein